MGFFCQLLYEVPSKFLIVDSTRIFDTILLWLRPPAHTRSLWEAFVSRCCDMRQRSHLCDTKSSKVIYLCFSFPLSHHCLSYFKAEATRGFAISSYYFSFPTSAQYRYSVSKSWSHQSCLVAQHALKRNAFRHARFFVHEAPAPVYQNLIRLLKRGRRGRKTAA